MKFQFTKILLVKYITLFLLLFVFLGCTKPVDFNQIDNATINTEYLITFVNFEKTAVNFLDTSNNEITFTSDFINSPFKSLTKKYIDKVELTVITDNTFNRDFNFQISFFDAQNNPVYTLQPIINIPANSSNKTSVITIPNSAINTVFYASYVGFALTLSPSSDGSTIQPDDLGTLKLKSSVKLYYTYRKI